MHKLLLAIVAGLTAYAANLFVAFLLGAFDGGFNVDPIGWLLLIGFLAITVLGARAVWSRFRGSSDAGSRGGYVAAALAALIGIFTLVAASRDIVMVALPMLALAAGLVLLMRTGGGTR